MLAKMPPSKTDMCNVKSLKFRTVCPEDSLSPNVFLKKKKPLIHRKKNYIYIYTYKIIIKRKP